ncbi:NAD(P)-dependent oxidoreductase [Halochromatium salexigens]|uniref:NAD(P)-dependent oxidoreductase n=1 Tax=Halochromatium salexigens TaxID=49447 RepID=UPI0023EE85BE|nr:NAD(P)-dependent oxidoreductase [Halochromatium salexigens]
MKIYVFDVENWEAGAFDRLDGEHEIEFTSEPLRPANASRYADAEAVSTFIYSSIERDVLAEMPKLEVIASRSTGVDYIDVDRCRERGVTVTNVPDYGKTTVAEHVFALLLTLSHRMEEAVQRTRRGDFTAHGLQGFDLRGKTIGVVGTGDIGRAVIDIARGFKDGGVGLRRQARFASGPRAGVHLCRTGPITCRFERDHAACSRQ